MNNHKLARFTSLFVITWLVAGIAADIGDTLPASVIEWYDPLLMAGIFIGLWWLGWVSRGPVPVDSGK